MAEIKFFSKWYKIDKSNDCKRSIGFILKNAAGSLEFLSTRKMLHKNASRTRLSTWEKTETLRPKANSKDNKDIESELDQSLSVLNKFLRDPNP